MVILKLNTSGKPPNVAASPQPTPTPTSGAPKIKLSFSQPPTPASEVPPAGAGILGTSSKKKKPPTQRKATGSTQAKKRGANEDISPAAKRLQNAAVRKPSISIRAPSAQAQHVVDESQTPLSAGGLHKIKLGKRKPSIQPRVTIDVKRKIPPRQHAVGYDSEDSETEKDPAVQNGFILRMQPGDDADYLRDAITNGKIGVPITEGGAQVTLKFIGKDQRRAIVRIKTRMYAAVLVDLPCIVETMKSWDKKGWWKVTDVCQMLLVLGLVANEDEAKNFALPKEVEKSTMQYAHGLTPPMHWVRKRRFRKRITQKHTDDIDARVKELLELDEACEKGNGTVTVKTYSREEWDRMQYDEPHDQQYDDEMDADGEAIETTEGQTQDYADDDEPEEADEILEAQMQAAFEAENINAMASSSDQPFVSDPVVESPTTMTEQTAMFDITDNSMLIDSPAGASTPAAAETPAEDPTQDEASEEDESDYDEDESEEEVVDEDAAARAAEKQQQLEEVADHEREIANVKQRMAGMTNQLLRNREIKKLEALEDSLRIKKDAFGLNED